MQDIPGISETWLPRGEFITQLLTAGVGQTVQVPAGQYLYNQGDIDQRFYVLIRGKVHVSNLHADGHESTFNIMGAGSVIGEAAALTGLPRYSAARVLEASELIELHVGKLENDIRNNPRFGLALIYILGLKQRMVVRRLHQAVFDTPEQRILRLLEQLADNHADKLNGNGDCLLRVNLTHEQIGNLTNLSRVTVTRTLQKLKRAGRVKLIDHAIVLSNNSRKNATQHQ